MPNTIRTDGSSLHVETRDAPGAPCRICGLVYSKCFPHKTTTKGGWVVLDSRVGDYIWFPPTKPESVWNIFHKLGIPTTKVIQELNMENEQQ
jgi:hypothetical protein